MILFPNWNRYKFQCIWVYLNTKVVDNFYPSTPSTGNYCVQWSDGLCEIFWRDVLQELTFKKVEHLQVASILSVWYQAQRPVSSWKRNSKEFNETDGSCCSKVLLNFFNFLYWLIHCGMIFNPKVWQLTWAFLKWCAAAAVVKFSD